MKNFKTLSLIGLTSISLLLSGCFSSSDKANKGSIDFDGIAVIQSGVFGSGSMIEFTNGIDRVDSRYNEKTEDDYKVFSRGEFYYQLGRFGIDTIQKYRIDNPTQGYYPDDGFSLRSAEDTVSANPYNMAFLSDSQAIITRYGATSAWVVNLDAQTAAEFLIRELDLSSHATIDGIPDMDMVFLHDGKAYITLQNLTIPEGGQYPASTSNEKIVVFNTSAWEEIDTDLSKDGTTSISLNLNNHQTGTQVDNKLYLGSLVYPELGSSDPATGGIEVVNLDDYSVEVIARDMAVNNLTSTRSGKVFFTSYEQWQANTLYQLNADKSYSKVSPDLESKNISALSAIEEALWLGYSDEGHFIMRLDARNNFSTPQALADIKLSQVEMALPTINIAFIKTNDDMNNLIQE